MKNKILKTGSKCLAAAVMSAAVTALCLMPAFGAVNAGLDTIDTDRQCSLHIVKYDTSSSEQLNRATGERDLSIENAMQDHAVQGVEFTVVPVGDIQTRSIQTGSEETVSVYYSVPDELAFNALGIAENTSVQIEGQGTKKYYTSDTIMGALQAKLTANEINTKNILKAYAQNAANGGKRSMTDAEGKADFTGLATGLYLVVETKVPQNITSTSSPFLVSLPMTDSEGERYLYDIYVYPKNQNDVPVIDKLVKNEADSTYADYATASVGDIVDYRVVTKVSEISDAATYFSEWSVTDTLTDSLDYVDITNKEKTRLLVYDTEEAAKQGGTVSQTLTFADSDYDIVYTAGSRTCRIALNTAGLANLNKAVNSGKYIVFSYQAKINGNAVLGDAGKEGSGNDNEAKLTWGRTSEEYSQTIKDHSRVYTYAIDLTKILSDQPDNQGDLLKTVEFTLFDVTRNRPVSADPVTADTYKVNDKHTADYTFSPASTGKLNIDGLAAGTYTLTEVKSASGYALLKSPITIVISSSEAAAAAGKAGHNDLNKNESDHSSEASLITSKSASAAVDGNAVSMTASGTSANAAVDIKITNTKNWIPYLPKTGGAGTLLLVLGGAIMIGFGLIMGKRSNRSGAVK